MKRDYSISHATNPSYKEHERFVLNHPYRRWYLVKEGNDYIGSVYIHYDNSIGVNLNIDCDANCFVSIFDMIRSDVSPLKPKPSQRYGDYFINVPPENHKFRRSLESLGFKLSQVTYVFPK